LESIPERFFPLEDFESQGGEYPSPHRGTREHRSPRPSERPPGGSDSKPHPTHLRAKKHRLAVLCAYCILVLRTQTRRPELTPTPPFPLFFFSELVKKALLWIRSSRIFAPSFPQPVPRCRPHQSALTGFFEGPGSTERVYSSSCGLSNLSRGTSFVLRSCHRCFRIDRKLLLSVLLLVFVCLPHRSAPVSIAGTFSALFCRSLITF